MSVRTRITATTALLVLIALTAVGTVIYVLERARLDRAAMSESGQELSEFRRLQAIGADPETGEAFDDVERLLQIFMSRNVPSSDELFVGWVDDRAVLRSASRSSGVVDQPAFEEAVRGLIDGGQTRLETATAGEILLTVQPVLLQDAQGREVESGALVVAIFLDVGRGELAALLRTYAIVAALSLVVITALAAGQAGRLLAPLRQLNDAARRTSVTDLSLRLPETGNDDITALTRTVNGMLERLETAFEGQRRFLDEAGHELRTPLTVLRGHLELLEAGSPEDVAVTRDLLLDEVDRMARLVGDMILLAKSSRPDFLDPRPVELDQLTHALLAKASALGDRDWRLDAVGNGLVAMDEQRITQAVLQLAGNAVKHTDRGDLIAIGSSWDGGQARLWVRDAGDGVSDDDRALIFTRFGRGPVRPGDEGSGLGLSIVRAIAEAHGGSVILADKPRPGATFVLTLPATPYGSPDASVAGMAPPQTQHQTQPQEDPWPAS